MTPLPETIVAALLATALRATGVLAAAAVIDLAVLRRRGSAAARHLLWCLAIAALGVLPLLERVVPAWTPAVLTLLPPTPPATAAALPVSHPTTWQDPAPRAPTTTVGPAVEAPRSQRDPVHTPPRPALPSPAALVLAFYAVGVASLLLRVVVAERVVRRLARDAVVVDDPGWLAQLDVVRRALGVRRPVTLLRGDVSTVPLTWGLARPVVLLPAEADAWPASRRQAVLLHEVAHVARHDCLNQTIAAVVCALYWPHPGVWWAAKRLRVERELACDDRALLFGMGPHDYAGHLLEIARGTRAPRGLTPAAVSMATSQLESRLRAIVDHRRVRTAPGRRSLALGLALAAAVLVPMAAARPGVAEAVPAPRPPAVTASPSIDPPAPPPPASQPTVSPSSASQPPVATPPVATPPVSTPPVSTLPDAGTWYSRLATRAEAPSDAPAVHVMVNTHGLTTFVVPLAQLDGLSAEAFAAAGDSARFRLRRDGGTFEFWGTYRDRRGTGRFGFTADPAFVDELARRGVGRPTVAQAFSLALHDVSLAFLDELATRGYATPSVASLVTLGMSGADLSYLRDVSALGYRFGTTGSLVAFANSGATPGFIRAVAQLGYRGLSAADLVSLRNHSLEPATIAGLNARAGRPLSVAELVAARNRGTTPAPPVPPASASVEPAPSSASTPLGGSWVVRGTRGGLVDLRLNWDDGTNWDQTVPVAALRGISGDAVASVTLAPAAFRIEQDAGVFTFDGAFQGGRGTGPLRFTPNRAFGATLRALGVAETDEVSDHQLKNLAWGGVSADEVRAFAAAGLAPLTLRGVVDLAIFRVTPDYVRALRPVLPAGPMAPADAARLRHAGLPAAYLSALAAEGVRDRSADELLAGWRERVTRRRP